MKLSWLLSVFCVVNILVRFTLALSPLQANLTLSSLLVDGVYLLNSSNFYHQGKPLSLHVSTRLAYITLHFRYQQEQIFHSFNKDKQCESFRCRLFNFTYCSHPSATDCEEIHYLQFIPAYQVLQLQSVRSLRRWTYFRHESSRSSNFCHEDEIFLGDWIVEKTSIPPTADRVCALALLKRHTFNEEIEPFKAPHYASHFIRESKCKVMPLEQSLQIYHELDEQKKHLPRILFVGDSLMRQLEQVANCDSSYLGFSSSLDSYLFYWSHLLRTSLCPSLCNDTFHRDSSGDFHHHICLYCDDNEQFPDGSERVSFHWLEQVNNETDILSLGTGAWYNAAWYIIPSREIFQQTLKLLKPFLEDLLRLYPKLMIVWVGLPPVFPELALKSEWEWAFYEDKNLLTKEILFSTINSPRFIFLDVDTFSRKRKREDLDITYDKFHWRFPGSFAIPSMMFEMILHLYARNVLLNKIK